MNPQQILRRIHNERLAKATSRSEAPVMHGTGPHSPTTAAIARPRACCASAATTHMPATNMSLGRESAVQQQQPPEAAAHMPAAQSRTNTSLGRAPDVQWQLPAAAAHMPPPCHAPARRAATRLTCIGSCQQQLCTCPPPFYSPTCRWAARLPCSSSLQKQLRTCPPPYPAPTCRSVVHLPCISSHQQQLHTCSHPGYFTRHVS